MSGADPAVDDGRADADRAVSLAFAAGEESALEQAYRRWGSLVHGLATRAVGPDDAPDVTQQVFVSAWRGRDSYNPDTAPLGAWLVGITRRRIADALRARHRHAEVATESTDRPDESAWSAQDSADLLAIYEELERIGDPPRQILLLAYVGGLTQREIAERLRMPLGTVKTHTTRTLHRLRRTLGGENDDG